MPKTAGTSFRREVALQFGRDRVLCDYGDQTRETSQALIDEIYPQRDWPKIVEIIQRQQAILVAGHIAVGRYGGVLGVTNTVTFLRDPVRRVISAYRHHKNQHGYQGDLLTFANLPEYRNHQSRWMAGLHPALFAVVGITEKYPESIELINHLWGWDLLVREDNVGEKIGHEKVSVTTEQSEIIRTLNSADVALYNRAVELHDEALNALRAGQSIDVKAAIIRAVPGAGVTGWAFSRTCERPARLRVEVNGADVETVDAVLLNSSLGGWGVPRYGYVGFKTRDVVTRAGDSVVIAEPGSERVLDSWIVNDPEC